MDVFGQSGCIRVIWLYSCKVVVFGKVVVIVICGCIPAKWLYSGKSGCTRADLFSGKVVVIWQNRLNLGKVVVLGQEWLYSGKVVVLGQKLLYSGKTGCIRAKTVLFGQ